MLRALNITYETPDYYDRTVGEIRAALQASAPSPADPNITLNHPPSPAAGRIEEARRDLWARIGGAAAEPLLGDWANADPLDAEPHRAAAEGSEPLDVERLARALQESSHGTAYHDKTGRRVAWDDLNGQSRESKRRDARNIAAAYASQTSEGTAHKP
jgi:hypothetical protein